ncbi:MAG TPA: DNA repair protein RadC [Rhodospirillales bacterium]|nr:DNA repair protein RadC [Rhodospirillales bacterium]
MTDAPAPTPPAATRPHYVDHRQRLRERFLASDAESLSDYELLELLLFFSIDRIDVKPLAKALLAEFGSLGAVLAAEPVRLRRFERVNDRTCALFKALREAGRRLLRDDLDQRPVISSWTQLLDYCRASLAEEPTERFRVLFLDRKNKLIADELQQRGTVDHAPVYPREVVKRALELGASALILVHNHPSGDPTPSKADVEITREVRDAAAVLGIALHDHVVVGRPGTASMKALGLI